MRKKKTLEETGKDVLLRVKVKPGSDEFKIEKINKWTGLLEIRLSQPAKKGKANKELIERLEAKFNKKAKIKTGRKSSKKTLVIFNSSREETKEILEEIGKEVLYPELFR